MNTKKKTRCAGTVIGRPKKKKSELASKKVGFRVTEKEQLQLEKCAKSNGLKLSQWLRELATTEAQRA